MRFPVWRNLTSVRQHSCKFVILILWTVGFWLGVCFAAFADNLTSLMRAFCEESVSIVGLFLVPFFPFLISAVAVFLSASLILYLTCFCKSFLLGFSVCIVSSAFSGGGWLICALLLFTDLLTVPALLLFQLRCAQRCGRQIWRDALIAALWFAAVSAVDRLWILPFLREII